MARRPKGEGSKPDQRADGRWQCYLTLPDDGRGLPAHKRRQWFYGDSPSEAANSRRQWQADQAAGRLDTSGQQTVAVYLRWWLATVVEPHLEASTRELYATAIDRHLIPAIGGHRLAALSATHVQELVRAKLGAGLARATVEKIIRVLHAALNYAVGAELLPRNRAKGVRLPPDEDRPDRPVLSPAQARTLLAAVAGTRLEAILAVAVGLGLRKGEALGLRWQDVTLERDAAGQVVGGSVRVVQQTQQRVGVGMIEKGLKRPSARRTIPLPAAIARVLADHRDRQRLGREAAGPDWTDTGLVFTTATGRALYHSQVDEEWARARKAAGLPAMRFHDLRHASASLLAAAGVPLTDISRWLGHTGIPMTLRYTHSIPGGLAAAAERIDEVLGGGIGEELKPRLHQAAHGTG